MEKVGNDRFIPVEMSVPGVSSLVLQVSALIFVHRDERLQAVSVEVLT